MATTVLILARTLHFGSAMMLFGLPYFMLAILRPVFSADSIESYSSFCQKMSKWLGIALISEAVSGAVWFWVVASQMTHRSPWGTLTPASLGAVLEGTSFGRLWLLRAAIGTVLGVALYFAWKKKTFSPPRSSLLNGLVVVVSGSLLLTLAWAGHVAVGFHHQMLHLLADAPHLLIGAIWPMGLFPMACFLWHIHRGTRALPPDRQIETLHRFSQTSFMAVLILIATGSVNGWLMIGSWDKLVTTPSGKLFLAKMVVVIVMIGIAAFNRFYLMRRIHDVPPLWRILRRTILAESGLAVVVLLIVAMHT